MLVKIISRSDGKFDPIYVVPKGLEKDLLNWLDWAEKQNERNKKWEEAQEK